MLGIPSATLRAWERRYGVPSPARTRSAYRLYGDEDVRALRRMRELVDGGVAPAEAATAVLEELGPTDPNGPAERDDAGAEPGIEAIVGEPKPTPRLGARRAARVGAADAFEPLRERLLDAVQRFEPDVVERELTSLLGVAPATDLWSRVLAPVLAEIGDRWHEGTLTVAQEHLASHAIGSLLLQLLRLSQPTRKERSVVLACFPEEQHQLAIYGVGLHFASWGFRTVVLGARTPPSAVARVVEALAPTAVAISCSMAPPAREAREIVDAYADACRGVPWIVGGAGAERLRAFVEARGGLASTGPIDEARDQILSYVTGK